MPSNSEEQAGTPSGPQRAGWRGAAANALHYSGALGLIRGLSRRHVFAPQPAHGGKMLQNVKGSRFAILCYHRIGSGGIPLFSDLPPAVFETQIKFLRRHYRIVSLSQLCNEIENPNSMVQSQAVAITFDDGYRDLFSQALPILKRYGVPATIFLPVASIDAGEPLWYDRIFLLFTVFRGDQIEVECDGLRQFALPNQPARIRAATEVISWLRTLPEQRRREECARLEKRVILPEDMLKDRMLTWEQIREMRAAGVEFGSHTMTHPVVSRLTQEQLQHEIVDSKQALEARIEEPVQHFAFPFGKRADCGSAAFSVVTKAGYRSASTTEDGVNGAGSDLLALNRVSLGEERHLPMFAFKMAQLFLTSPIASSTAGAAAEHTINTAIASASQR